MIEHTRIRDYVQSNSRRFIDLWKEAISIPSISAEGQSLQEMASWLEGRLTGLGAKVRRLEVGGAAPAILGEFAGDGNRTLMIYDHYDVQPVDPIDLWDTPPFEPTERDGLLLGRGAADNKGDLVARLCALEAYRDLAGDLPFNIKFFVEGEEESGSLHFEKICQTYAEVLSADDCVWEGAGFDADGRPEIIFGCKGLLYIELKSKVLSGDQHSSIAVIVPSAAWELLRAINSMKDETGKIVIDGFHDDLVTPGSEELRMIDGLNYNEAAARKRLGIDSFVKGLSGAELRREMLLAPTANIAGFISGYTVPGASKTVLPAEALAKMDFRLVPDQNASDLAKKVKAHLEKHGFDDVELSILSEENPSRSAMDSTLGGVVRGTTKSWFTAPESVWPWMVATGPMYPIAQELGVPITSPPGVDRPDSKIHAPNENVRIDDYLEIIGFTIAYLQDYGIS